MILVVVSFFAKSLLKLSEVQVYDISRRTLVFDGTRGHAVEPFKGVRGKAAM